MNTILNATKLGLKRGLIEFRQTLTEVQDLSYTLVINGILLAVMFFQRNAMIGDMSLSMFMLPSVLGMLVAFGGIAGAASALSADREDGTLLRAKAIPQGMVGYLTSRIVVLCLNAVFSLLVILIPGLFFIQGLTDITAADWLLLLAFWAIGLLATLPWGAVIGSLVKGSSSGFGITFLIIGGITAISGIFYPITAMAGWIQAIAQMFPIYWLGHGMRAAILPDGASVLELGGAWNVPLAFGVLAVWALAGLIIAPRILRRMAKRESGSAVAARKQQILSRGY